MRKRLKVKNPKSRKNGEIKRNTAYWEMSRKHYNNYDDFHDNPIINDDNNDNYDIN